MIQRVAGSFAKAGRSFGPAWRGLGYFVRAENNARMHLIATILALLTGAVVGLSTLEWCVVILQIGFVWTAEVFNTAVERTIDYISLERNPKAGAIKDLAAAGVLVAAITAVITGALIFGPKIFA